jgi:hypothetical protein
MILFLAWSCSSDSTLHPIVEPTAEEVGTAPKAVATSTGSAPTWEEQVSSGSAMHTYVSPQTGFHKDVFDAGSGASTPIVDFLFVVDDSVSMNHVLDPFRAGFLSLTTDAFPEQSKIAVMTMTPADPKNLAKAHHAAHDGSLLVHDPGFLGLVTNDKLVAYRARLPQKYIASTSPEGCDAWFSPSDRTASGVPCLVAHTTLGLTPNRVESGLVSFRQLLEKQGEIPLFRAGAAVNVIFVSDTHDPGFLPTKGRRIDATRAADFDELVGLQPTLQDLETMILRTTDAASIRFHAIAPRSDCSEKWSSALAPAYFDLAEASGGATLDICTATDYTPVVKQIVDASAAVTRSVFVLGEPAKKVESVTFEGAPVGWSMGKGGVVKLDDAVPTRGDLEVVYAPMIEGKRPVKLTAPIKSR